MALRGGAMVASMLLISGSAGHARAQDAWRREGAQQEHTWEARLITLRPGALAALIDTLAGGSVRLTYARVVGVFDPRVFLVESQTRLLPVVERDRVLVFIETGTLRVDPAVLVASTVTVSGIARTLVGMQTSREVPWPTALTRDAIGRLEIRAAVLARSVQTPEGIDLLARSSSSGLTPDQPSACGR